MRMLSKHDFIQRDQLEMITLDQQVPPNDLVHKMEAAINLKKIPLHLPIKSEYIKREYAL